MWIVRLALRRPYTFVVTALLLLLLTPFVLLRTPTDIFPSIDIPVVSVIWQYSGLNAQEMEQRIAYMCERIMATTVSDIEHLESTSYNGIAVVKVFLQPGASIDAGLSEVSSSCQTILRNLPTGVTPPLIIRYNASTVPILQFGISGAHLSEAELFDVAMNQIRPRLITVPGVSIPAPYGGRQRVVSVDLDLTALKAKNLAPVDIVNALDAQNFAYPTGTAKIGATEYDIELNTSPRLIEELNDLPIKTVSGAVIRIRDVAQVRDGYAPQRNIVRQDGIRSALLTIYKSGGASTLQVANGVKELLPRVLKTLTTEVQVKEFADQSIFVRTAINDVLKEGLIAGALTALMILLFIGSWRSTLIIALSIPLSVLTSIACLSALGETINLMTLGGLALAVGILVDEATVTIENIHRQLALGKSTVQAILDGAQEIALPAFVSMICICIVFVPMFFLTGTARYLFTPLAKAVVFAMFASYIFSRTLVPTLVMWLYRNVNYHGHLADAAHVPIIFRPFALLQNAFERGFNRFREQYRQLLGLILQQRMAFAVLFLAFCGGTCLLIPPLGQDFFPSVDAGQFRLHIRGRSGLRIEETAKLVDEIQAVIRKEIPAHELVGIVDNIGIPNSSINLSYSDSGVVGTGDADILVSLHRGHRPTDEYVRALRHRLNREFPGVLFYFLPADIVSQTINFGLPAPFNIQILGRNQAANRDIARRMVERIRHIPGAVDVRIQQPGDRPKLEFVVDRTKASEMELTERDVAESVLLSLSGSSQVRRSYWLNPLLGIQYSVSVRVPEHQIDSIDALRAIPINASRPGEGDAQLLANVAEVSRSMGPPVVSHRDILPVIDVFGGVSGRDLGGVLRDLRKIIPEFEKELPRGSSIMLRGQAETMRSSFVGLGIGFVMAIALIYLLLVVNFQSWLDPFIIITALPGAVAGVVWALHLTFTTLSVPALMGAIMCLGVATANSVLVVTFARNNLREGMPALEAAWESGVGRLRPVLMTALAMIIGMLPMSLGLGEGGEQNAPLGRAAIGGLAVATLATLFFVPVVFSLLHRRAPKPSLSELDPALKET
ncbi:MAG: efflux RND transporter permease subunit [Verrucomicrobia bacterium]|nr:efflux RND transporter permease subunit [Verrucomicrobiota bacterium]